MHHGIAREITLAVAIQKIGSQGLHVATALESSHTRERDAKRWQLLWTECVSGQSPALTFCSESHAFLNRDVIRIFAL